MYEQEVVMKAATLYPDCCMPPVPLATFPTPSLISASAVTFRSVSAGATVSLESKNITANKNYFLIRSLISPRYNTMTRFVHYKSG